MGKEYKLNIDARILELLGPNLYTNIYYVLAELIANAYDADAKNVYIVSNRDEIIVEDDGHGMSYNSGDVKKFLNVAAISRTNNEDSSSRSGRRMKMGRKGVGKLAALSISENVDVMTIANGEKSGFVLSRHPNEDNNLTPISEDKITFNFITENGTAIVMKNPQYRLHRTLFSIRRNLLKIFPLVNDDFRIHIIRGSDELIIDNFDQSIMSELNTLITLGDDFKCLKDLVDPDFPERKADLIEVRKTKEIPVTMKDCNGFEHEYTIKINGWIGTYKSTRGRKAEVTDFPDNFISLYANKKLGEFNILPIVGQNKLAEVYVVGQLHIDIFELSELPDMALSNRQGYKSDDKRYELVCEYVRKELLEDIIKKRSIYIDLKKKKTDKEKVDRLKHDEAQLKQNIDRYRKKASEDVVEALSKINKDISTRDIEKIVQDSLNKNSLDLGLKPIIDSQKRKILISQTLPDKAFADVVYQMLIYNNVPQEEILYTNCDNEASRIPEGEKVYNYLKEFFVDSYSTRKIYVIFVTSENTKNSWGAITEVGAAWITQINHKIFTIHPFRPEHPLDDETQWQQTNREDQVLWISNLEADKFCSKIESICDSLGCKNKSRGDNINHLKTLISVR